MSLEFRPGYGGPYVSKTEGASPQKVVWELMMRHRGKSRAHLEKVRNKLEAIYVDMSRGDPDLADANAKHVFTNCMTNILNKMEREESSNPEIYEAKLAQRETRQKEISTQVKVAVDKVKRALVLDAIMPNGLAVRDCKFSYIGKMGGVFAKIAKLGKPNQIVGEFVSNEQAERLMK